MTRERAIQILKMNEQEKWRSGITAEEEKEAVDMAIEALKEETICPILSDDEVKQPCIKSPCGIERPHGEWIDVNGDGSIMKCSRCGEEVCCKDNNFCPNCDADMRKEGGENAKNRYAKI